MKRAFFAAVIVLAAGWGAAPAQEAGEEAFGKPIFEGGGIKVNLKVDFEKGGNPFINEASGVVDLESRAGYVVGGRSLHVKRAKPTGYFGGRTNHVAVKGTRGLNIAFCVRAEGMEKISLNFYDALARDNATPASPARVRDDQWRPVVFAVEDFHHNAAPPQRKVPANTKHTSMFFHGREQKGKSGQYWIDKFIIYRGVDAQPPAPPANVKAKAGTNGTVELTWREAKDNAFAAVYSIYRRAEGGKWTKIAETVPARYVDTVPAEGRYGYRITAADYDNNVSMPSKDVSVTSKGAGSAPRPAAEQVKDRMAYADNVRKIHAAGKGKVRHDVFLFAGDSITAADAYTFTLGSWLARGITVRRGVGQMRTGFGKARIEKYLAESGPEFAIVMYGTNDSKSPQAVAAAMENLSYVIDACAKRGTVPVLATIPPRGYSKEKQDGQKRFNEALIKLCRDKKVPISYCYEEIMKYELKKVLGDGVHLTSGPGNDAAGASLRKTFDQIYWALRDTRGSRMR